MYCRAKRRGCVLSGSHDWKPVLPNQCQCPKKDLLELSIVKEHCVIFHRTRVSASGPGRKHEKCPFADTLTISFMAVNAAKSTRTHVFNTSKRKKGCLDKTQRPCMQYIHDKNPCPKQKHAALNLTVPFLTPGGNVTTGQIFARCCICWLCLFLWLGIFQIFSTFCSCLTVTNMSGFICSNVQDTYGICRNLCMANSEIV